MDKYRLPKSIIINDVECDIAYDFRDALQIFQILNDPDLLEEERILVAMQYFYKTDDYTMDFSAAALGMFQFLTGGKYEEDSNKQDSKPLYDWDQDFDIIVAPINRTLGFDVRGTEELHWWTFLSAFMEIGECTFNTFVGIRDKLNRNVRLEKHEEKIYKDHRDRIVLKHKYDSTTQALMDEIMGKGN